MDTREVYKAIADVLETTTRNSRNPLTPHPAQLVRGAPAESRAHLSYRIKPLPPASISQQGHCLDYDRQWSIVISARLDDHQLYTLTQLFDLEDTLVSAFASSDLNWVIRPPVASYDSVENARYAELTLTLDTNYRRQAG